MSICGTIIRIAILLLLLLLAGSASASDASTQADSLLLLNESLIIDSPATADGELKIDSGTATIASSTSPDIEYPMTEERREKLISYSRFTNIWRFVSFFTGLAVLAVFLFSGLSAKLRDLTSGIRLKFFMVLAYFALFTTIEYLFTLPLNIYRNFIVEGNYGFMNQSFMQWWSDDLLSLSLSVLIGIVPVWFFYWLIGRVKRWWLAFSIGAIPFLLFFVIIAPVLISPLFNEYIPLKDQQLKTEILSLAEGAGIEGSDVFQVDASKQSSKINAYVTGMFGTKRIVLFDTLIRNFSHDEIMFVMAHEMGHYVMDHLWQGIGVTILFMIVVLWLMDKTIHSIVRRFKLTFRFSKLGDIASLPLVLAYLTVISFISQPITNGFGRYIEHQADEYGMRYSGVSGESAAIAFDKLSVYNLSDPNPSPIIEFWFYNHPALNKRMEYVRNYQISEK